MYQKTRFHVFKRDNFRCQYCGRTSDEVVLEVDHIVPISKGGKNNIENLITSCRECNRGKSDTEVIPGKNNFFEESKKLNHDLDVLYLMGGQLTNEMFELSSKIKETKIELFKSFYNYLDNHDGNFTTEDLKYKNPHETMEEFREKYLVTIKMKMLDYISQLEAMEDPNEIIAF